MRRSVCAVYEWDSRAILPFLGYWFIFLPAMARADMVYIARDVASNSAYDDDWSVGDNGYVNPSETGFQPWSFVSPADPSAPGRAYVFSSQVIDISTGANAEAFAVQGMSGGVGAAVRPFTSALSVGQTFSLDMDNQDLSNLDASSKVGFELQNSTGGNVFEFYLHGGAINTTKYTFGALNPSVETPFATLDGLRLTFTLVTDDFFTLAIDLMGNGTGVDRTITGNLLAATDQAITQVRLYNANGGPAIFFNNLRITAVPEVAPASAFPVVLGFAAAVSSFRRSQRARS